MSQLNSSTHAQKGNAAKFILSLIIVVGFFGYLYLWYTSENNDVLGGLTGRGEESQPPTPILPPADEEEPAQEDDIDDEEPADLPEDEGAALTDDEGRVFSYLPVGDLLPDSGPGLMDDTIYRPSLLFPVEDAAFLNSQVYRYGGMNGGLNGMNGGQCEAANYDYPWQDTFCEKRSREQPLCPGGGHEGLDIRPATCAKNVHWAIAVEDARVVDIRRHWVTLQTADGTLYNYLHLNMEALEVSLNDTVSQGDRIGLVSNDFYDRDGNRTATTTHLHFEMYENYVTGDDSEPLFTKVNPYMTLVSAYDRKLRED